MNIKASQPEFILGINRSWLAVLLLTIFQKKHVKAIKIDGNSLQIEYAFQTLEISLDKVKSTEVNSGWYGSVVAIFHDKGTTEVSGLSPSDAHRFVDALEVARVCWWKRTLAPRIDPLRSICEKLTLLVNPSAYQRISSFAQLRLEAESAAGDFQDNWPKASLDMPELGMLKVIQDFLKHPENKRKEVNAIYVANELKRSRELFDQVEKRPLTEEQRKSIVIDDDRNLVIAAAGSGKTSVIVAKIAWLMHKGYRKPSELLLLAFSRDARKEIEERVRENIRNDSSNEINVSTFHSLGLAVIGEVEGRRPSIARVAEDSQALISHLKGIVSNLIDNQAISESVLAWFRDHFAPYRSHHEFTTWGAYYDYIRRYEIRSLQGDKVKSFEECEIANFLYLNGIHYEYERIYKHKTASVEKGPYRPDFYLPDFDIWIEHFGINAEGKTAPFVPQKEYLEEMEWKRNLHEIHSTTLIETFSYECTSGNLLRNLEKKLLAHDVFLSPLPPENTFAALENQGWIDPFIALVAVFLRHFKGAQLTFEQVLQRADSMKDRTRAEAFLTVFRLIYKHYQDRLDESGEIDYQDMISKAAEYIEAGRYQNPFRYILVDEFQDISRDRARLLGALLGDSQEVQLFAVGDDWQSIYRFTGSDVAIVREFSKHFGDCERLTLETTFRCNNSLADVATKFILQNPAQIPKAVQTRKHHDNPSVHVGLPGEQKVSMLQEAFERIAKDASKYDKDSTVLLLGRYNHLRPQNISSYARKHPGLQFTYKTVHGSKGLEADYVVVIGLCTGKFGFPSEIADDPLLDLVLAAPETYPNAEERRLLYVAITRARRQTFLLVEDDTPSSFVNELIGSGYEVTVFGRILEHDVNCPVCIQGRLLRRENKRNGSIFYGCSNYPYCENRIQSCPLCSKGLLVKEQEKFKCRNCSQSVEACPICDGWLEMKMGRYGRFFGCVQYPTCDYTRNVSHNRPRNQKKKRK